jgi:hypothetical protein
VRKTALNLESEDISVPNNNNESNCFQICISRHLHLLGQTLLQLVISGVMVDWSLSGVIVPILIIITYLTMKPKIFFDVGNYIGHEIFTFKLSKL